jgi:hypothetical protein
MEKLSPYIVMLTTNLEPVYGIVLAYSLSLVVRKMSTSFILVPIINTVRDIKLHNQKENFKVKQLICNVSFCGI